ncbi:hypothetical protein C2E23DRAFT_837300 [Lenzites betulinus]|nr:hypothetical protein C2E23DRAFT_837300 [Lenzites betulinus]
MAPLDSTFGPMLIGVIVAGIMYGVTCSQTYYYFSRYSDDHWSTKLLVVTVWTADTVHQALISHSIYWYLITEYGNPIALTQVTRTLVVELFFNYIIGLLVQSFFAARIWKLSEKRPIVVVPILALAITSFVTGITYGVKGASLKTFMDVDLKLKNLSIIFNTTLTACDVTIAVVLCAILHSSRTGFSKSDTLITKLMVFAVNTGLLTSVSACLSLITFLTLPNTLIYISFFFVLGRLYSNSLMATLNARKRLRSTVSEVSVSLRDIPPSASTLSAYSRRAQGDAIAIRIEAAKGLKHDPEEPSPFDGSSKHPSPA